MVYLCTEQRYYSDTQPLINPPAMKIMLPLLVATFCAACSLFAQAPAIEWQNTIGGNSDDYLVHIQPTIDGGYILGGDSNSNISGDKVENSRGGLDYWIVKLNAAGTIQWQKTIGGDGEDQCIAVQPTMDGGYIVGGYSYSNSSGDKTENSLGLGDYWIVKLDGDGNLQWQNTIGGSGDEYLLSIQQLANGDYILGGVSSSNISGDKTENNKGGPDGWVVQIDMMGNVQWQKTIGGSDYDDIRSIQQTTDGGFIFGGQSKSDISGDKTENSKGGVDFWVVKLSPIGNIQWQKTIGGDKYDALHVIQQTIDEGYVMGGYSLSSISGNKTENGWGNEDYWVVKLDENGNIQWQNTVGGNKYDNLITLREIADTGYVLGGFSISDISGNKTTSSMGYGDYWLIKLDPTGKIQWQSNFGGSNDDYLYSVQLTPDGGYILGGYSLSNISGDKTENSSGKLDCWIIKLSPDLVPTAEPSLEQKGLVVYPNPTADALFVQSIMPMQVRLCNALGQTVAYQNVQNGSEIDLSNQPDGFYFLIETATGQAHKILKTKQGGRKGKRQISLSGVTKSGLVKAAQMKKLDLQEFSLRVPCGAFQPLP